MRAVLGISQFAAITFCQVFMGILVPEASI